MRLCQQELDSHGLTIVKADDGLQCLSTIRPLKEGQVVLPMSALWFHQVGNFRLCPSGREL